MVDESRTFGLSTFLLLAGLAITLFGVTLNNGQSLNGTMLAGGAVVVVSVGLTTAGIMALDEPAHAE